MKKWFDSLKSEKGPCCSDADGTALSDVDWESKDGHYRVRLNGQWIDVPDDALVTEPNLVGRTMVYHCSHSIAISADRWPDDVRLSDLEARFAGKACGKRGADVRPNFNWNARGPVGGMG